MTDLRPLGNGAPVTPALLQLGSDSRVNGLGHAPILVKDSCYVKEQITRPLGHPARVTENKTISEVVADNLAYWMKKREWTQTTLAQKAGVSQKTVSNYLNPAQRADPHEGKPPSPKLVELDQMAQALGCEVWELTRSMTEREREFYALIETAYDKLRQSSGITSEPNPAQPQELTAEYPSATPSPKATALERSSLRALEAEVEKRAVGKSRPRRKGGGGSQGAS